VSAYYMGQHDHSELFGLFLSKAIFSFYVSLILQIGAQISQF